MKTILVTGAAGFIGAHLSRRLTAQGIKVVGLDNLNDYYDPQLKKDRMAALAAGANFVHENHDLSDRRGMEALFRNYSFDAVVNFAAIHHVPLWQDAVREIHRVLKPGGKFFFQEVTARWILRWPYRMLFAHPMENRFSGREFIDELERLGIIVGDNWVEKARGDFIFGVGQRQNETDAPSSDVEEL